MTVSRNLKKRGRPALFTAEQVRTWREQYEQLQFARANYSMEAIAKRAGVTFNCVRDMIQGITYKWVD